MFLLASLAGHLDSEESNNRRSDDEAQMYQHRGHSKECNIPGEVGGAGSINGAGDAVKGDRFDYQADGDKDDGKCQHDDTTATGTSVTRPTNNLYTHEACNNCRRHVAQEDQKRRHTNNGGKAGEVRGVDRGIGRVDVGIECDRGRGGELQEDEPDGQKNHTDRHQYDSRHIHLASFIGILALE